MFTKVNSSNIDALAFEDDVLKVKFKKGTEYHYEGVSEELFEELLAAESVGKTFNEKIRSQPEMYPFHAVN